MTGRDFTKSKFFLALENCLVVSFFGHGSTGNKGNLWLGKPNVEQNRLTGRELEWRYQNWIRIVEGKDFRRTDLSHLKLVVLLACWSGGQLPDDDDQVPDEARVKPNSGSVAGALRKLNVQAVVFTIGGQGSGALNADHAQKWNMIFWDWATKGELISQNPLNWKQVSVARAVEEARDHIQRRHKWIWPTVRTIHVDGDTNLAQ
ncbi:MAG: hypothetical protein NZT92_03025 [Abditibacteriales bacterium]|nr:hypothetical protein [Abditibacteriales bacterium]